MTQTTHDSSNAYRQGILRPLSATLAVLAAPVFCPFAAFWLWLGPSSTGWLYLVGAVMVFVGLLTAPWRRTRRRGVVRAGLILVCLAVVIRVVFASEGTSMNFERVGTPNLVADHLNRIVPEPDSAIVGGQLIVLGTSFIHDPNSTFIDVMRHGYRLLAEDQGVVPSPWPATYLGMQSSRSFDMQSFSAEGDSAVIFLHGFGGNFTLPCWEVAQAAQMADVATFCPSTEWQGRWWMPDAQKIVRTTIEVARARGYRRVFLAGLSNGGIGLSRTATEYRRDVAGFILISGVSPDPDPVRRPTLVVHGDNDTMTKTSIARRYAKRSIHVRYEEFEGGHFILLEHSEDVRKTIGDWLKKHTRRPVP